MAGSLFNVEKQLSFYGAYHSNKINIAIHMVFVPLILWANFVWLSKFEIKESHRLLSELKDLIRSPGVPEQLSKLFEPIAPYLSFEPITAATGVAAFYWLYFFALEPIAAVLYLPMMAVMLGTATSLANHPQVWGLALKSGLDLGIPGNATFKADVVQHFVEHPVQYASALQVLSWIMQFVGHGAAEGRAPALLDNLAGALILAPFFVHLEILFALGYRPKLHRRITNLVGVEVTRVRSLEAKKQRAKIEQSVGNGSKVKTE